jgi:hypothetical protein
MCVNDSICRKIPLSPTWHVFFPPPGLPGRPFRAHGNMGSRVTQGCAALHPGLSPCAPLGLRNMRLCRGWVWIAGFPSLGMDALSKQRGFNSNKCGSSGIPKPHNHLDIKNTHTSLSYAPVRVRAHHLENFRSAGGSPGRALKWRTKTAQG